jgi:UDP-N-acetylglucosamine diphosphorylase/glucosamine-1-phosphate N-acetyltransferase
MENLLISIMAGGLGKRMESNIPKVLHKLGNYPLIIHIINTCLKLKPKKILIIVGKYKDIIEREILQYIDESNIENYIEYVIQKEALGTGDAIKSCIHIYKNNINCTNLILSGDVPLINEGSLKKLIKISKESGILINELENPKGYGRIIMNNKDFIKIVEEKDCNDEERKINIVNSGIYCISCELLVKYLPLISNNNKQNEYYLTDILEIIKNNENSKINLMLLEKNRNYEVLGINNKQQLEELEIIYNNL